MRCEVLKVARRVLLAALVMMPSAAVWAQSPPRPRFGDFGLDASDLGLLSQKSVQDELALSGGDAEEDFAIARRPNRDSDDRDPDHRQPRGEGQDSFRRPEGLR